MRSILALFLTLTASLSAISAQEAILPSTDEDQIVLASHQGDEIININAAQLQLIVNVEVAAPDAGLIKTIDVIEGKNVEAGDIIIKLDRDSAEARAAIAKSELDIAIAESENDIDLRFAKVSQEVSGKVYERSQKATERFKKSVSATELEGLKLEFEKARLTGEQAERTMAINEMSVDLKGAQKDFADVQLRNRDIETPVSGMIAELYLQKGEWAKAGQPVARVIDLKKLRVSCRCYLKDADPESLSEDATFVYNDDEYKAKVVFASPEIDPDVQDFIVWAEVENPDGTLKPGMRGSIRLKTDK